MAKKINMELPTRTGNIQDAYNAAPDKKAFLARHPKFAASLGLAPAGGVKTNTNTKIKNETLRKRVKQNEAVANRQANRQIQLLNPNYNTTTGSSTTTINADGSVSVNNQLSPEQQAIYDRGVAMTQAGQGVAADMLKGYQPFSMTGGAEDRARIEDEMYRRLTKNFEQDMAKERRDLEQTLYNRGIPLDPTNPQYQQHMKAFDDKWSAAKESARGQAVQMAGQEMTNSFNMGLQSHQQYLGDMQSLQGMGTGLMMPNLPGYQAPSYNIPGASETDLAYKQYLLQKQQLDQQNKGSGGGSSQPPPPPFLD